MKYIVIVSIFLLFISLGVAYFIDEAILERKRARQARALGAGSKILVSWRISYGK